MSDKRQDLIAICEFIMSAQKLPTDPLDLISAMIEENRRLNAELRQLRLRIDQLDTSLNNKGGYFNL